MSDLPPGWSHATIGDLLLRIEAGKSFRCEPRPASLAEWGIIKVSAMTWGAFREGENKAVPAGVDFNPDYEIKSGDILVSRANTEEYVGAPVLVDRCRSHLLLSDKSLRLVPSNHLNSRWLYYLISSSDIRREISRRATGTKDSMRNISQEALASIGVKVPPLAEQNRIVAALDDHLSRLEVGVATLQSTDLRLRQWFSAFLASSTRASGNEQSLPGGWRTLRIRDMAHVGSGATPLRSRGDYYEDGTVPWITSSLLNNPFIDKSEQYVTEKAVAETAVKLWPVGTLLVAMYGEGKTRGHCSELKISATTNQACAAIVVFEEFKERQPWIKLVLESSYEETRNLASGGVQPNLSLGLIKDLRIPMPPYNEQERILAEVERIRYASEILQRELKNAERKAKVLRRSLLRCAFTGQLVPQDLVDEPASLLLERIRTERATRPQARRVRKGARHNATQEDTLL